MNDVYNLLVELTEPNFYDTEYDGRMYSFCCHCGKNSENDKPHETTCVTVRSKTLINLHFPELERDRLQQIEKHRVAEVKKQLQTHINNYKPTHKWVQCVACKMKVNKRDLKTHINSARCIKTQKTSHIG